MPAPGIAHLVGFEHVCRCNTPKTGDIAICQKIVCKFNWGHSPAEPVRWKSGGHVSIAGLSALRPQSGSKH